MKLAEFLPIIADPNAKATERLIRLAQFVAKNGTVVSFGPELLGIAQGMEHRAYAFRDLILVFNISAAEAKRNPKAPEVESTTLIQVMFTEEEPDPVGSQEVCQLNSVVTALQTVSEHIAMNLLNEWAECPPTEGEMASLH